jgi:hypothetical protein
MLVKGRGGTAWNATEERQPGNRRLGADHHVPAARQEFEQQRLDAPQEELIVDVRDDRECRVPAR